MIKRLILILPALFLFFISCQNEEAETPVAPLDTRFELMPPEHTGIDFIQTITEEYRYNFSVDANIFNGGGVAVLDVNNDGLQDLFFTSRLQSCKLYLNKGDLQFEDISEAAGVTKDIGIKTGVTVVDINADGWQDVYVCRTFLSPIPERKNLLFVNNGDNTFTEQAGAFGLDDDSPTQHAHFFDYDLDGDLDCYLLNHPVDYKQINNIDFQPTDVKPYAGMRPPLDEYESDKLYRNDGGQFTDVSRSAGINNRAWGLSVMSNDFNEDGYPDLYVANDFIMPDFLYINNGDGTFTDKVHDYFQHMTNHAMGIEIADLNNDGLPEVAALDMLGENWERRHRQLTTMQLERYKQLIRQGYGDQQMRNTLQLNNGQNHFSEIGCLANMFDTEWSWAPLAADFDHDGWKDLFITNGVRRDLNDIDFFVYTADSINRTGGITEKRFKNFEDFSNLMPSEKIKNRMFQNSGSMELKDVTRDWGFAQPTFSNGAAYTDLDNDGDLDIVVHNIDDVPFVYKNKTNEKGGGNWLQIKCKGTAQNPVGTGARIKVYNNDELIAYQEISPVRGFYSSIEPLFQVGLGAASKADVVEIIWPEGKHQVMENVDAGQRITLNIANAVDGKMVVKPERPLYFEKMEGNYFTHRENSFEDFNIQFLLPHRFSRQGPALAVADVNGDGDEDFFIGGGAGQEGRLFVQQTGGGFKNKPTPAFQSAGFHEDVGAVFFDVDQDGDQDLYVVSGGNERPVGEDFYADRLYINDGNGNFVSSENQPSIKNAGKAAAAYDYDKDGDLDLFVAGRVVPGRFPEAPQSFILENKEGEWVDVTDGICPEFRNIGMVTDLKFADVTGNGEAELIVAGEWMPITLFEIQEGRLVNRRTIPASSGWWNCLEAADLDGDGDLDLIAGNLGLNTRFEAPLHLYAQDFDSNGSIDPILCVEENGRQLPVPMRDELIKQLPHLKKKFVRNTAYARTDINGIFSKEELAEARYLRADVLATSWFENDGSSFKQHDLPDRAQIAPVHGITVADFNEDGHKDLLMVGNDSGYDVQTGPLDTSPGCLLLGDGKGVYTSVPPARSGCWAVKEARGIFPARRSSGEALYLVPNNDNDLLIFREK